MKRAVSIPIAVLILLLFSLPFTSLAGSYTNVTVSEAESMIDSNPSLVVLDVRTQTEYDSGHIGNAKLIPVTELEGRLDELHTSDEILVYCRSGVRSATASQILADNGFLYVHNMLGGIIAWIVAGYAVYVKYSSIQEAINNASEGDTIFVSSGTYYENVIVNKTLSLFGEGLATTVIDGGGGSVVQVEGSGITISGFTMRHGGVGIQLWDSFSNIVCVNNITCNSYGIMLYYSSANSIFNNNITRNSNNGIEMNHSPNNNLSGNNIANNGQGIRLSYSSGNNMSSNYIINNGVGIELWESTSNNMSDNDIAGNNYGIGIYYSSSNIIYHNNFRNNTQQVYSSASIDIWDDSCEGNYWSDYYGIDFDGNGIGDTPYVIDENNIDRFPLMNPYWNPADVDHDLDVDLYDAVRLLSAYGSKEGDENYNCHCDIAEPYGVINLYDAVLLLVNYGEKYP